MRRAVPRSVARNGSPATRALLLSFFKVRILHHTAAGPVRGPELLERLSVRGSVINGPTLNRILARMARSGWLKRQTTSPARAPAYALTWMGRKALEAARMALEAAKTL